MTSFAARASLFAIGDESDKEDRSHGLKVSIPLLTDAGCFGEVLVRHPLLTYLAYVMIARKAIVRFRTGQRL